MNTAKTIDYTRPVYELCKAYPEIKTLLAELGFTDITKPGMLQIAGRFVTIPRGAQMKGIDLAIVTAKLHANGFTITEGEPHEPRD